MRSRISSKGQVTVPAEGSVTATLTLDGSKYKRVQHKNKFGKDYPAASYKQ